MVQMSSEESSLGHAADQASCGQRDSPPPDPHPHPQETRAWSEAQQVWCIQVLPQPLAEEEEVEWGAARLLYMEPGAPRQATPWGAAPATHSRRGQGEEKAPASPIFGCSRHRMCMGRGNVPLTVAPNPARTGPPSAGPDGLFLCRTHSGHSCWQQAPAPSLSAAAVLPPVQPLVCPFLGVGHHPSLALAPALAGAWVLATPFTSP